MNARTTSAFSQLKNKGNHIGLNQILSPSVFGSTSVASLSLTSQFRGFFSR